MLIIGEPAPKHADRFKFSHLERGKRYQALLSFGPSDPVAQYVIDTHHAVDIRIYRASEGTSPEIGPLVLENQFSSLNAIYKGQLLMEQASS